MKFNAGICLAFCFSLSHLQSSMGLRADEQAPVEAHKPSALKQPVEIDLPDDLEVRLLAQVRKSNVPVADDEISGAQLTWYKVSDLGPLGVCGILTMNWYSTGEMGKIYFFDETNRLLAAVGDIGQVKAIKWLPPIHSQTGLLLLSNSDGHGTGTSAGSYVLLELDAVEAREIWEQPRFRHDYFGYYHEQITADFCFLKSDNRKSPDIVYHMTRTREMLEHSNDVITGFGDYQLLESTFKRFSWKADEKKYVEVEQP